MSIPADLREQVRQRAEADALKLLQRYQEIIALQVQVNRQLTTLSLEQQALLQEQRDLLEVLMRQLE